MSDDGEPKVKSSKLARLSFALLNLVRRNGRACEFEEGRLVLQAKYPIQGLHDEYSSAEYAH